MGELALLAYAVAAVAVAAARGSFGAIPFLLLYVVGFAVVAGSTLWQGLRSR